VIQRLVLVKLNDEWATSEGRTTVAEYSRALLNGLPRVKQAQVGIPADAPSTQSWDVSFSLTFDSMEDIAPYIVEATHRDFVDNYLSPKAVVKKAWNFDVGNG